MPDFMKHPAIYAAATIIAVQFVAGTFLDLILGACIVGLIAYLSADK